MSGEIIGRASEDAVFEMQKTLVNHGVAPVFAERLAELMHRSRDPREFNDAAIGMCGNGLNPEGILLFVFPDIYRAMDADAQMEIETQLTKTGMPLGIVQKICNGWFRDGFMQGYGFGWGDVNWGDNDKAGTVLNVYFVAMLCHITEDPQFKMLVSSSGIQEKFREQIRIIFFKRLQAFLGISLPELNSAKLQEGDWFQVEAAHPKDQWGQGPKKGQTCHIRQIQHDPVGGGMIYSRYTLDIYNMLGEYIDFKILPQSMLDGLEITIWGQ